MMKKIKMGDKFLGDGERTFVVAEAGSNHNGELEIAKKMIRVAADAGADAIKFQIFIAEKLYVENAGEADYLQQPRAIYDIIKNAEMPFEWLPKLKSDCKDRDIIFLATPFDEFSADKLEELEVPAYKISSFTITHIPLLKYIAKKQKPVILSTGASNITEISDALQTIYEQKNEEVALLQCVSSYPAPLEYTNLKVIKTLKQTFQVPVGISDHSENPFIVPFAATALGADLIEKHFTLDRTMPGPDHKYAIEPDELKAMINGVRGVEKALGSSIKKVTRIEKELYQFAKRRIHAIKDIKKGEILTEENIAILRSGKTKPGLHPKFWDVVLGKRVIRGVKKDEGLTWDDLLAR